MGQVVLEMPKMSLYLVAVMILILVKLLLKKISKLSKENQNYFHKCDDAINNKLSVDSLVYYSSFILPIICILIFIRIGKSIIELLKKN